MCFPDPDTDPDPDLKSCSPANIVDTPGINLIVFFIGWRMAAPLIAAGLWIFHPLCCAQRGNPKRQTPNPNGGQNIDKRFLNAALCTDWSVQ